MTRYAENTTVAVDRSKAEIERTLSKYGATQFMSGWDASGKAMLAFVLNGRMIRLTLQLPPPTDPKFQQTPQGRRRRNPEAARAAHEQECRPSWRALGLVVRAKLEAVELGISTLEEEFLSWIVLPNGSTAGQFLLPQIEASYKTGKMPALLPGAGGTGR